VSTRSVRLDDEAEKALSEIVGRTGLSISDAIKQGLIVYREKSLESTARKPADFFNEFDLGEGGYSIGSARQAKTLVKQKLHARRAKKPSIK